MRIALYIIIISALHGFNVNAQQVVKLQRKLQWNPELQTIGSAETRTAIKVPFFEGAHLAPENDYLPNYFESVSIGSSGTVEARIVNPVFEPLPAEAARAASDKIQGEIIITSEIGILKKRPVASVSFIPIRKNSVTGNLEKLTEFDLEIRVIQGPPASDAFKRSQTFASNSVLSSGMWHKISVDRDGIFKLDYNFLRTLGVNVDNIDPRNLRIFGNGGGMLPEANSVFRHDDLVENPIFIAGESDGRFNQGDYVLFYGQGPHRWRLDSNAQLFRHQTHLYSEATYYFINTGGSVPGKRWSSQPSLNSPNVTVTGFDDYAFHEKDEKNLLLSGREWYGEFFGFGSVNHSFSFNFPNLITSVPVSLKSVIAARSTSQSCNFSVTANGQQVNAHAIASVGINYTDTYAREDTRENAFNSNSSQITVNVTFLNPSSASEGWLNYIELNVRRTLAYNGTPLIFRDKNSVAAGNRAEFVIQNATSNLTILDVTNPVNVSSQQYSLNGSEARFTASADSLREFIAFVDGSGLSAAKAEGVVENQNLHSIGQTNMLIITHPSLTNEANMLADHHFRENNLSVEVVNVLKIYNEFSSGAQDISAIRDFVRMIYVRAGSDTSKMPKYLLMFGDASYDYKDRVSNNTNLVPTFQSQNSLEPVITFVTDDYFGLLDDNEGGAITGGASKIDIAIGRLPAATPEEARNMVNKIIHYQSNQSGIIAPVPGCAADLDGANSVFGNWRNVISFVGDDEDGNIHMTQANDLAAYFENNLPVYNIDKIFLDAYPQQSTPGGSRYPDVNEAINRRIFSGALIMNYTGHGGVNGWAHERILDITAINSWTNFDKLPLFITATCEFSKFDDPGKVSAGEMVLLNPNGGAIAMVTTTRLVFSGANYTLNNNFLRQAFNPLNNHMPTMGEAIMNTKNAISSDANNRKFILLGDPAVALAYPRYHVVTTAINDAGFADDTLKALRRMTIKGEIRDEGNNKMTDFHGIVYPTIYDKKIRVNTLQNDPGARLFSFDLQKNIIYNGKASVNYGEFSYSFIVPKDIAYNMGEGKISYYSDNGLIDANGYTTVMIGGTATDFENDDDGPDVDVFMNNEKFVFGGITNQDPLLLVKMFDASGINTVGTGIGHDITAVLDENTQKTIVLNEYYKSDLDDFQSGKVEYPLANLEDGRHTMKVKAWDVFNNSTEGYTEFVVANNSALALKHILNYPNPFTTHTSFLFEHNCPCTELMVTIKIMTVSGKVVKSIVQEVITEGFRVDRDIITWDGLDDYGQIIGRGVYVYRLNVRTPDGNSAQEFEKLVILR